MPPKRKAATKAKAGGKKAKVEEDKPETTQDVIAKLKASENKSTSKKKRKVDSFVPMSNSYEVTAPQYKAFLSVVYRISGFFRVHPFFALFARISKS